MKIEMVNLPGGFALEGSAQAPDTGGGTGRERASNTGDAPILGAFLTEVRDFGPATPDAAETAQPEATVAALPAALAKPVAETADAPAPDAAAPASAASNSAAPAQSGFAAAAVVGGASTGGIENDYTPADPLYVDQWHFPLMGDIETVWDEYSGVGVSVYVTDDGVEYTHEDLDDNYDASMHFFYDGEEFDPTPRGRNDGHGTSCAGLIAAEQGNGLGGTGVAWSATITGLDFLNEVQFLSMDVYTASLEWAENFDVMSNSWGITPGYADFQSPFDTGPDNTQDDTAAAFEYVSANGRDGLGTVIAQASGNDTRNAQGDALNGTRFTVSVAATDELGFATYYTNYGTNILLTAPAGAVTVDLDGFAGYDRGPYTDEFGGTSAATPITAGVIALMLEANEGLGWRDVHSILAASASHTGSAYDADTGAEFEQGLWFANDATNWNGGGMMFNLTYGFGMVDAYAAVRMAEIWDELYGDAKTSANESHVSVSIDAPTSIPTFGNSIVSIDVPDEVVIENIQVTLDITHGDARDLEIWLVSPDGTQFMLFEKEGNGSLMDDGFQWIFGIEAARGMTSAGEWELLVLDSGFPDSGTINAVTLDFYGSEVPDTEVHHITDDFAALVAIDADRGMLSDDGGTDALNMAAVSGDIFADLAKGGSIEVDGESWATFDTIGGKYEDIYTGDGNDEVYGNNSANILFGMRGDDEIFGRTGSDTIDAGTGDDSVSAGAQDDYVIAGDGMDTVSGGGQNDDIKGGKGADNLRGQRGEDTLDGGAGKDILNGGEHSDQLRGGDGQDSFVFVGAFGQDTITDFELGVDVIDVSRISAITDFDDLVNNHLSNSASGAVITAKGHTITVEGVLAGALTEDDFVF